MQEMKEWLKLTAKEIRRHKGIYKDYQRKNNGARNHDYGRYHSLATAYRTNHIAYSLAKGRTLEQICRPMKDGGYKKEWFTNQDWLSIFIYEIEVVKQLLLSAEALPTESTGAE